MSEFFKKIGLKPKIVEGDKKWQYVNGTNMKDVPITSYTNPTLINEIIEIFPDLQGDTDNARYNRELLEGIIIKRFSEIEIGTTYYLAEFIPSAYGEEGEWEYEAHGNNRAEALENLAYEISDEIKEQALKADWRF